MTINMYSNINLCIQYSEQNASELIENLQNMCVLVTDSSMWIMNVSCTGFALTNPLSLED